MPILDEEIVWRPAALNSDALPAQNGGRMRFTTLVSGVKNNLFPDVSQNDRLAGSVTWRKAFIHLSSAQDSALLNVRLFLEALTPAGDCVLIYPGTANDTADQVTSRPFGIAMLEAPVASGAVQLRVRGEHPATYATLQPFRLGDLVRIADRPGTGGSGNEDWATVSAVAYSDEEIIIDLAASLTHAYEIDATRVTSVWAEAQLQASASAVVVSSAAGSVSTAEPVALRVHNKGGIAEAWQVMFTDATTFTVSGLATGTLPEAGVITADYRPLNPATGTPYFTLPAAAWQGTFQAGDTVSFETVPAALAVWYRREVPAGTASLANDYASLTLQGESD